MGPPWLTCPQPRPEAAIRLISFPHAGGGAASFYQLAALLPAQIELRPVQLPGRESRLAEPPYKRLPELVAALADALREVACGPYAFFGHSMGALIAFELAREFRRRKLALPQTIVVSGRRAPTVSNREPPLHPLPDAEFVAELVRRYDAIPRIIRDEPELMALFVPVLKADFAVFETHRHRDEEELCCRLGIYGGTDDPQTGEMDGWAELVTGAVRRRRFDGGHFYFMQGPDQRRALATALAEDVLLPAYAA